MSEFQWFAFDIKAFVTDTLRMKTCAKGAYLMLLLDYYQHGNGCYASVSTLSAVTGLSEEEWGRYKPEIMECFEIRDGRLWHARVEQEMLKSRNIHSSRSKAGKASAAKRWGSTGGQQGGNSAVTGVITEPQQEPQQTPNKTMHNNNNIKKEESSLRELKKKDPPDGGDPPRPPPILDRPMPTDFALSPDDLIRCQNDGATPEWVWDVFGNWKQLMLDSGALQPDWKAAWWRRWEKSKPMEPAEPEVPRGKPRLVVTGGKTTTKTKLPPDWQPNANNAAVCAAEGYDLDAMAEHFRDVCGANGYRYANHHQAFSNFIRNQKNFERGGNRGSFTQSRGSIVQAGHAALAQLDERIAAARAAEARDQGGDPPVPELPED